MKIVLVSAVALIDADGRVLLAQRPEGKSLAGLWEFPGGKVDPGETPEAALIRELREELGIETKASCLAPLTFAKPHEIRTRHPNCSTRSWTGGRGARARDTGVAPRDSRPGRTVLQAGPNVRLSRVRPPGTRPRVRGARAGGGCGVRSNAIPQDSYAATDRPARRTPPSSDGVTRRQAYGLNQ